MKKENELILSVLRNNDLVNKIPILKTVKKISKIGTGASHLNYLIATSSKKIILRIDIDKTSKNKLQKEFRILKAIEKLNIAPKPLYFKTRSNIGPFLLLEYLDGVTLDKTGYKLSPNFLTILAREIAKLHSIPVAHLKKDLPLEFQNLDYYLQEIREYRDQLKPFFKSSKLFDFMDEMFLKFEKSFNNCKFNYKFCMIHGDVQEQNIILNVKRIKLIDWESTMISDPATEISYIVTQFGEPFSLKEKNKFIDEYLKVRKDASLKRRVELYIPIKYYVDFLWSLLQTAKIKRGLVYYSNRKNKISQQKEYTLKCIKRMVDRNIIGKREALLLKKII